MINTFKAHQLQIVNESVELAEELVSNFYKMSASQWRRVYDIKTLAELYSHEIVDGPLAQVIRYEARPKDAALGSAAYDFYKICLQDHNIFATLERHSAIQLYPLMLYIVTHELIHVVRFCRFLQFFDASPEERADEEIRVHERTRRILSDVRIKALDAVLNFYSHEHTDEEPLDALR